MRKASRLVLALLVGATVGSHAQERSVTWAEVDEADKLIYEEYMGGGKTSASAYGMNVYDSNGVDHSESATGSKFMNNQWVYRVSGEHAVLLHNSVNELVRGGLDEVLFVANGNGNAGFLAQVGSDWYVSDVLLNPRGTWVSDNEPNVLIGFAGDDPVWRLFHTGSDLSGGFTVPDYNTAGAPLPPGNIVNTGMYKSDGANGYTKSYAALRSVAVVEVDYVASSRTDWTDAGAWSDGNPAAPLYTYMAETGVVLETPAATATFPGLSLTLTAPQRMEVMVAGSDVITVDDLLLDGGDLGLGAAGASEAKIAGNIKALSHARISGATTDSRDLRVLSRVQGADDVELTLSHSGASPASTLFIDSTNNTFSGTWVVTNGMSEFSSPETVGSADIDVRENGMVRIVGDWDGLGQKASLKVANGSNVSVDLGANNWTVVNLMVGASNVLSGYTYDVATLNAIASNTVFSGTGTIQVGLPYVAPGLVAHWKLDEGNGTETFDSSGYGWTGVLENGVVWGSDAERGTYLAFNGSNSRVVTEFLADFTAADKDMTWAVWANSQVAATESSQMNAVVIGNRHPSINGIYNWVKLTPTKAEIRLGGASQVLDYEDFTVGEWHHHALVKEGTNVLYYIDGVSTNSRTITTFADDRYPFFIGGDPAGSAGEHFNGFVDDVALYNYALSATNVVDVMNGIYVFGPTEAPVMEYAMSGGDMVISWPQGGFKLQTKKDLVLDDWADCPGGSSSPVTIPATNEVEMLRLIQQ